LLSIGELSYADYATQAVEAIYKLILQLLLAINGCRSPIECKTLKRLHKLLH